MPDPESVKRALARLAARPTSPTRPAARLSGGSQGEYRTVIDRASAAVEDLAVAAEFADAGGLARLEAAIEQAESAGDHAAARRGREALSAFQTVRAATELTDTDHFHSGRGTPLGGGNEGAGK